MEITEIERKLSAFIKDLENENRLVRVGLKDISESAKVFAKYKDLFSRENLVYLKNHLRTVRDKKQIEIISRIYFTIAKSYIGNQLAKNSDRITTYFSRAAVKYNGETISYYQIAPKISKENIFEKREKLESLSRPVVEKINREQLELLESEIKLVGELGFGSYLDFISEAKNLDYLKFYKLVLKIQSQTEKIWERSIAQVSQEIFKRPFKNIASCHMSYLRSVSMFDSFYPKEKVVPTFVKFVGELGLSTLLKSINIDDQDRPEKNPRAVCYWPDPPSEIHLVIKPIGGEQDFEAIFHEGGHALYGASVDPKLPYTFRGLARSNALTEAYAFILEDLVFDPLWLTPYLNVSAHTAGKIHKQAYFVNLMLLRRYLGKFIYEYKMFSKNKLSLGPNLYKKSLDDSTGFAHNSAYWLSDMDSGFYSADYLRAWIGAAQIKDYLAKKFGEKWFINPKAGKFWRDLWSSGVTYELEEAVAKLGYKPFDISYLIKSYEILT